MTPPLETLSAWFWDFLGLAPSKRYKGKYDNMSLKEQAAFRKRKAARIYSKDDRRMLANKSFARGQIHEGVNLFMIRRKEKQLGTYNSKKHVVRQKFDELQGHLCHSCQVFSIHDFKTLVPGDPGYSFCDA